ncbi:MAG: LysM peptidoglycan-binding domain-containing protein [Eubacteriales bacterium]|nr:LysM peptidoglycan-binding domain-containing protein [Eubacteriales bacterium]
MKERDRRIHRNRIRRIRQLRRRMIFSFIILCFSAMTGILGCSFLSKAQADGAEISYKYFTSVRIEPGDTLYSIAQEHADEHYSSTDAYIEEVCRTNHLTSTEICAGDYLIIPYYSSEFR